MEKKLFEAKFWKKEKDKVRCNACNRNCLIAEGSAGFCRVRKNVGGKLYSLVYGKTLTLSIDPIEKKPLFHFFPGSLCLGVSTFGCNFSCLHCQNFHISQQFTEQMIEKTPFTFPKEIVSQTLAAGVQGIAFTYTEPTIFIEYAIDTMKEAKKFGLYTVFVSNGYMSKEVLKECNGLLDAVNVDLKGNEKFYKEICGGVKREKVLENIEWLSKNKIHTELTTLIIPGYNDSEKDFKEISKFVFDLNPLMPLHFSRFYPMNRLNNVSITPEKTIFKAKEIAEKIGLKFVYTGNLQGIEENSFCPECKNLLIKRRGYAVSFEGLVEGKCNKCGRKADFILNDSQKSQD